MKETLELLGKRVSLCRWGGEVLQEPTDGEPHVIKIGLRSQYQNYQHLVRCELNDKASMEFGVWFCSFEFPITEKAALCSWAEEVTITHRQQALYPGTNNKTKCIGSLNIGSTDDQCLAALHLQCPNAKMVLANESTAITLINWVVREADCILPILGLRHKGHAINSALVAHAYGADNQLFRA